MFGPRLLPRTLDACLRDLSHTKVEVRLGAVRDLAAHATQDEDGSARNALGRALREDAAAHVRAEAAIVLADVQAGDKLPVLCDALEDPALSVRQMALVAVGELATRADARAADAVRALLDDPAPAMRFQALIAAKRTLPRAELARAIEHGQGDEDAEVRYIALRLAEELQQDDAQDSPLLAAAGRAAEDESARVRLVAAIVLTRAGDEAGPRLLAELLNGGWTLPLEDEQVAIELAGEFGIADAQPGLERRAFGGLLGGSPLAWHARVALARQGHIRAKRRILRGLSAWTRDGRTLAVEAAGAARLREARARIEALSREPGGAEPEAASRALALIASADESE
ncbi:MAG: HEAT repeat domain-containing protein [Polyangiaceae bacterium]